MVDSRQYITQPCHKCGQSLKIPIGPTWWIGFRDQHGKYHRQKIGERRQAVKMLNKALGAVAAGTWEDARQSSRYTLGGLAEIYGQAKTAREVSALRAIIRFLGASTRLDKITTAALEEYVERRLEEGRTLGTIRRDFAALGGALTLAVKRGWLHRRPRIPLPRVDDKRERFLSKREAGRLLDCCEGYMRPLVHIALLTGMRQGEILKMRWAWINPDTRTITIPSSATKTDRTRHVPINDELAAVLGCLEETAPRVLPVDFHIFTVWEHWDKARNAAGLADVRFHDLRHTAASWMVQAGVDLYRVGQILGHADHRMTQRYAHLAPGHLRDAIQHTQLGASYMRPKKIKRLNIKKKEH